MDPIYDGWENVVNLPIEIDSFERAHWMSSEYLDLGIPTYILRSTLSSWFIDVEPFSNGVEFPLHCQVVFVTYEDNTCKYA